MQFKYYIGTKALFGKNVLGENKGELGKLGKKAFIVAGRNSARASGALDDAAAVLNELGIEYVLFDSVENNPSLENVQAGGRLAAECGADFIIGIGGGSPLDAAKAIAVLAVNKIDAVDLYKNVFENKPLPIAAIPTTAGTGSEVTPYSILTRKDLQTKMSFGNEDTFPRVAFLDARYTESLNRDITVNTAVDAFSHAVEGYLNIRSTPVSDSLALEAIELFGKCTGALLDNNIDFSIREKLLYVSMLGGMVISHTGTTSVHGMGYSLTFFKDIPHGMANGLLLGEYLKYVQEAAGVKVDNILRLLGLQNLDEFKMLMARLLPCGESFSYYELENYSSMAMLQKSAGYNLKKVTQAELFGILKRSLK